MKHIFMDILPNFQAKMDKRLFTSKNKYFENEKEIHDINAPSDISHVDLSHYNKLEKLGQVVLQEYLK